MTQNGHSWVYFFFLFQTMYGTICCYWQHQAGIAMYMLFAGWWGGSLSVNHFLVQAYFQVLMCRVPCLHMAVCCSLVQHPLLLTAWRTHHCNELSA